MKKTLLIMLLFLTFKTKIFAEESIFEWPNNIIEVDVYDDINKYILEVKNNIKLKKGYNDAGFYVEDNHVNYTTISTISTSVLKSYTHYFKAVSPKYKISETKAFTFKVIDREKPKILSSSDIHMIFGGNKPNFKLYINAYDNYTNKEDLVIEVDDSLVDYKNVGIYSVIYTISDSSGNFINHISKIIITDNIPPTIKSTSNNIYNFGDKFNIYDYFIIEDNYDTNLIIDYTISPSLNRVGETILIVTVKDSLNNVSTFSKMIMVVDNKEPEINLFEEAIYWEVNSGILKINDYFIVSDNYDSKEELTIEIIDNIDYEQLGKYYFKIIAIDSSNNKQTKTLPVYIIDSTPPTIKGTDLIKDTLEIDLFEGIIVEDNYNQNEEIVVLIYQTNFQNKAGKYFVIYEAKDSSGNVSYLTRNIIVKSGKNEFFKMDIKIIGAGVVIIAGGITLLVIYLYKRKTS